MPAQQSPSWTALPKRCQSKFPAPGAPSKSYRGAHPGKYCIDIIAAICVCVHLLPYLPTPSWRWWRASRCWASSELLASSCRSPTNCDFYSAYLWCINMCKLSSKNTKIKPQVRCVYLYFPRRYQTLQCTIFLIELKVALPVRLDDGDEVSFQRDSTHERLCGL